MSDARVELRAITDDDHDFLYRVYASTREEELAPVPWSDEQKEAFLRFQYDAQHKYWQEHYADAAYDLVVIDGEPAGRFYVDRRGDEIRVVDVALLPAHRGRGVGGRLMRRVMEEAAGRGVPVRIHVEQENPAMRLYDRLGFVRVDTYGVYHLMEWRPGADD